jgi:hypothetical protein
MRKVSDGSGANLLRIADSLLSRFYNSLRDQLGDRVRPVRKMEFDKGAFVRCAETADLIRAKSELLKQPINSHGLASFSRLIIGPF